MRVSVLACSFLCLFATKSFADSSYTDGQNAFTFDMLRALGKKDANICISPYNISSALQLAYFGAENATKTEIGSALHLPMMTDQALTDTIMKYEKSLGNAAINAKAVAVDRTFLPTDSYLQTVKDGLQADVFEVNFIKEPQEACKSINDWASKMTKGRITSLLEPANVTPATRLVLLSSIYIKAAWTSPFEAKMTQDAPFKTLSGQDKTIALMQKTENMRLYQDDKVQVVYRDLVQKDPQDARLEVVFVLPQDVNSVQLSQDLVASWDKQQNYEYVQLFVPKCQIRERLSVKKPLQALGIQQAFTQAADFTAISPKNDLMISDVLHAAFLMLDEAGIEAAAATAVVMMTKSALVPSKPPVIVRCDKPFYVLIREKASGLVLFASLIASPEKVEK